MDTRLNTGRIAAPTGNNGTTTPATTQASATATLAPATPRPNDTRQLATGTAVGTAQQVDVNALQIPGEEGGMGAGEVLEKLGKATRNQAFRRGAGLVNAPQIVMHVVEALADPTKGVHELGKALSNPRDAWDAWKGVQNAMHGGGLVKDQVGRAAANIGEHGVGRGLARTAGDVAKDVKTVGRDFKEGLGHNTGGALHNIPRALTREAAEVAEKKAGKAMLRYMAEHVPGMAPKSWFGRAWATVSRVAEAPGRLGNRLMVAVDRGADWLARKGIQTLNRMGRPGAWIREGLHQLHPASSVSRDVLKTALEAGKAEGVAKATEAALKAAERNGVRLSETALKGVTEAGARAAAEETARLGTKAAGKGLGRFAPGVNIAIAAYDTYHCYETWRDPNAGGWQKGMATATAVFSWAAATNIPIVSQIGAGLSIVTSLLEHPKALWDGIKAIGSGIGRAASWVGSQVASGARAVGSAIATGARAVGSAVATGARAVGSAVATGARAVGSAVASGARAVGSAVSNVGSAIGRGLSRLKFW